MLALLGVLVLMVIVNLVDAATGGIADTLGIGKRPATWVITMLLLGVQLGLAGFYVKGRWDGVFIDEYNRISLARFQLVLWTGLLVSALISAGLSNAALRHGAPLAIDIPATVWSLLGLSGATFVSASLIMRRKRALDLIRIADQPNWLDLIRSDNLQFVDIGKLQKLSFTIMLFTIYAMGLYDMMGVGTNGLGKIERFPRVDDGFVALVGLSHAAYLAIKSSPLWLRGRLFGAAGTGKTGFAAGAAQDFGLCADFATYPIGAPLPNRFRLAGFTFSNQDMATGWQVDSMLQDRGLQFHPLGCRIELPAPVSEVGVTVGTLAGPIKITALDAAGGILVSKTVPGTNNWTSHQLQADEIKTVVLAEGGDEGLLKEICIPFPA